MIRLLIVLTAAKSEFRFGDLSKAKDRKLTEYINKNFAEFWVGNSY